jgi:hypothetical protein
MTRRAVWGPLLVLTAVAIAAVASRSGDSSRGRPATPLAAERAPGRTADLARPEDEAAPGQAARERIDAADSGARTPATGATLSVLITAAESPRTLVGVEVLVFVPALDSSDPSESPWRAMIETDEGGRAVFDVPADTSLHVTVRPRPGRSGRREVDVDAIAAQTQRGLAISVPTDLNPSFWGRVVAAHNGHPIAGASVALITQRLHPRPVDLVEEELITDLEGVFEVRPRTFRDRQLRVSAPGFAVHEFTPERVHANRAEAFEIELSRTATLLVAATDGAGAPLAGAAVRLTLEDISSITSLRYRRVHAGERREGVTSERGRCELRDLPPGALIEAEVVTADGHSFVHPEAIALLPGESRTLAVSVGADGGVEGRVVDAAGGAVGECEIWLQRASAAEPRYLTGEGKAQARATTDREGRFDFADVPVGDWWVAPSPKGSYAPRGELVRVELGKVVEVEVQAWDLTITGSVIGPYDRPLVRAHVIAIPEGGFDELTARWDADGRFVIGPLAPGRYEVFSKGSGVFSTTSPAVVVGAGATDVVLRQPKGGVLLGRLESAGGRWLSGEVRVVPVSGRGPTHVRQVRRGDFSFARLAPGRYDVVAVVGHGSFGLRRDVEVREATHTGPIEIEVTGGATLELSHEGIPPFIAYEVRAGRTLIDAGTLTRGTSVPVRAPSGLVVVTTQVEKHRLQLAPGGHRQVALGRGPQ